MGTPVRNNRDRVQRLCRQKQ